MLATSTGGIPVRLVTDAAVVEKRERDPGLPTFRAAWAYGQCGPRLFALSRRGHAARPSRGRKVMGLVGGRASGLVRRSRRRQWVRTFAIRCGRLAGSAHLRVFFP